jgi:hypothetical protein
MRSERGQATVEWIGIVLLVAVALAALSHFAPSADGRSLATTLLHSVTCAARDGCEHGRSVSHPGTAPTAPQPQVVGIRGEKRNDSQPPAHEGFTVPPLVPPAGQIRPRTRLRLPSAPAAQRGWAERLSGRALLRWARRAGGRAVADRLRRGAGLAGRLRRGAGLAWRRAWYGCLAYERARYAFLHPESRFPGHTIPPSEVLRMANDCISPIDLVRDWPLLRNR